MGNRVRLGQGVAGVVAATLFFCVSTVAAARITSPNYQIDGNLGGSFGGETNSSSYRMTAIGGETMVGNGSSGSYLLDQQSVDAEVKTMQLGVQPSGLVGFYPMDENTGTTTADASRYQTDATFGAPVAWRTDGKLGAALNINGPTGTNGTVAASIPDNSNLPTGSQMTFEAWVNASDVNVSSKVIAAQWRSGFSTAWLIQLINGKIWVSVAPTSSPASPTDSYTLTSTGTFSTPNVWRHVTVVYDGGLGVADRVKVYIDGARQSVSVGGATAPVSLQDANVPFTIGGSTLGSGQSSAFPGSIDHAKLFSRALSSAEVVAEYNAQSAGASSGFGLEPSPTVSTNVAIDAIVRTNSPNYTIGVQQDHDLQSGGNTIPSIGGSIGSPATWTEGVTRGFGFTLTAAPVLDAKWNSGSKYAAVPNSVTTFYAGTGNVNKTAEVVSLQLRLHPASAQTQGVYSNAVTYTGTMTP